MLGVGLAPSSAHERTKRLYDSGIVAGSHAVAHLDQLGFSLKALLFIQMSEHEKGNLSSFLNDVPHIAEVRSACMITGRFDAVIVLATRNTEHLHSVVVEKFSSRPEVHRIETSVVFENIEKHDVLYVLVFARREFSG
tara:strand:- start:131 stop:544 length:414 start_codon:yes stop_codon:yes gene_type:complete